MTPPATPPRSSRATLWAAFFTPALAWFVFQQGLGMAVRVACEHAGPPYAVLLGAVALLVCLAAALIARRSGQRPEEPAERSGMRRFLAQVTIGMAAVFGLGIAYQTAAVLLVPSCFR